MSAELKPTIDKILGSLLYHNHKEVIQIYDWFDENGKLKISNLPTGGEWALTSNLTLLNKGLIIDPVNDGGDEDLITIGTKRPGYTDRAAVINVSNDTGRLMLYTSSSMKIDLNPGDISRINPVSYLELNPTNGLRVLSDVIFNYDYGTKNFEIRKQTSGKAFEYLSVSDTVNVYCKMRIHSDITPSSSLLDSNSVLSITKSGDSMHQVIGGGNGANQRPMFTLSRYRNTINSPTVLLLNDTIGSILFQGYDGSARQTPALIESFVDGDVSAGSVPARLSFVTGSSISNRQERLTIYSGGDVSIRTGNLLQPVDRYHYWGNENTDGSWRFGVSGNDFIIQKRESGTWMTKQTITA